MERIERNLQPDSPGSLPLKRVLIPLGRSLQRAAAAPQFFAYPRVVVVPDAEPRFSANDAGMLIKDRLYLGYQEKANIIEVISYNEAAGRFEFQLVKDYRAGRKPQVFYANRAICTACHQNAAPLFSRQVWDETNANPRIAALLREQRPDFYGIDSDRGVDVPYAIDNATDRANLYSAYQRLWGAGCGSARDDETAVRCRASLYTAALQYRLSGKQRFDETSRAFREHAVATFARSAREHWPHGLQITNPDIPNRDPFMSAVSYPAEGNAAHGALADSVDVQSAFDPLNPRPAFDTWFPSEPATLGRLVAGLSEFISDSDVKRLDAHLHRLALRAKPARKTYAADCDIAWTAKPARRYRVDFECPERSANGEQSLTMRGSFYVDGRNVTGGALDRLQFFDHASAVNGLTDVDIAGGTIARRGTRWSAALLVTRAGGHVRRGDGNTIESLHLTWTDVASRTTSDRAISAGRVLVTIVQDFAPVQTAIEEMIRDTAQGKLDVFADKPFRRARLMPILFERLAMKPVTWCCVNDAGMPPAAMETHTTIAEAPAKAQVKPAGLQPFYRYCATCHQSTDRSPPNFLQGSASEVAANLAHCAQRLYVRLSMWQLAPEQRPKTAMPPYYALYGFHVTPESWRNSSELAALRGYVQEVLKKENGKAPRSDELMGRGYENLRACLPAKIGEQ